MAQLHAMLNSFIALLSDFNQTLLCLFEKCKFSLLTDQLLLELFVLLKQKMECILQVLVAIDEDLVILIEVVDQIFDKEQVICVKGR